MDYIAGKRDKEYEDKHKDTWTRKQWIIHKEMQVLAWKIRKVSPNIKFEKTKAHTHHFKHDSICNDLSDRMAKFGRAKYYER